MRSLACIANEREQPGIRNLLRDQQPCLLAAAHMFSSNAEHQIPPPFHMPDFCFARCR